MLNQLQYSSLIILITNCTHQTRLHHNSCSTTKQTNNLSQIMIRLASIHNANAIGKYSLRQLVKHRIITPSSSSSLTTTRRTFADDAEKPKGIPYSKLTLGVPKETFPLEKRVAATPEVSLRSSHYDY